MLLLLLLEDDSTGGMGGGDGREWAKQTQRCRRHAEGGNLEQQPEIRGSTGAQGGYLDKSRLRILGQARGRLQKRN